MTLQEKHKRLRLLLWSAMTHLKIPSQSLLSRLTSIKRSMRTSRDPGNSSSIPFLCLDFPV